MSANLEQTERTRLGRLAVRGTYDREEVYRILDEGILCHVGFNVEGHPFVIPTNYARVDDKLIIHGSVASRMLTHLAAGFEACVTVTLLDGLVLARSAFHHSINYRSVVLFGTATAITGPEAKREALDRLVEHLVPGRTRDARGPSDKELRATEVLEIPIDEGSAKIRKGPPSDDDKDMDLLVWAGVIPLKRVAMRPEPAPELNSEIEAPDYVTNYRRPGE